MTSESRDDIKAIQRLSDGAIVTLGEHQKFYETKTQYEIWQSKPQLQRITGVMKRNTGFVFQY